MGTPLTEEVFEREMAATRRIFAETIVSEIGALRNEFGVQLRTEIGTLRNDVREGFSILADRLDNLIAITGDANRGRVSEDRRIEARVDALETRVEALEKPRT